MACGHRPFGLCGAFVMLVLVSGVTQAQTPLPNLTVEIENGYLGPYDTTTWVTIFLTNPYDSIEGVQLRIYTTDTSTLQFTGEYDTAGTLLSGWGTVGATIWPGEAQLGALANYPISIGWKYILPSDGPRPLVRYRVRANRARPDAALAYLYIDSSIESFGFSDPRPDLIGLVTELVYDSVCFRCLYWDSLGCYNYEEVFEPPCDSVGTRPRYETYYDTSMIHIYPGSVFLDDCCVGRRGNVNFDRSDMVDGTDLAFLVAYMQTGRPLPICWNEWNINGVGIIDLSDLALLIVYLTEGKATLPVCP